MNQALSPADALKEIQRLLKDDTDAIPDNWHTAQQLADAWGLSLERASAMLLQAVGKGIAERKKFRISAGSVVRPVWHYQIYASPLASPPAKKVAPRMPQRLAQ